MNDKMKTAKKAEAIFEKHWVKSTDKPLDEMTKHHMKYAIEAVEEALKNGGEPYLSSCSDKPFSMDITPCHHYHNTIRVRFCPKDTEETFEGTLIDETKYFYLVVPDDNPTGTARWNIKCCVILNH